MNPMVLSQSEYALVFSFPNSLNRNASTINIFTPSLSLNTMAALSETPSQQVGTSLLKRHNLPISQKEKKYTHQAPYQSDRVVA